MSFYLNKTSMAYTASSWEQYLRHQATPLRMNAVTRAEERDAEMEQEISTAMERYCWSPQPPRIMLWFCIDTAPDTKCTTNVVTMATDLTCWQPQNLDTAAEGQVYNNDNVAPFDGCNDLLTYNSWCGSPLPSICHSGHKWLLGMSVPNFHNYWDKCQSQIV